MFLGQQHPLNKRIDAAVQHIVDVSDIHIDAVILYHLIGMQDIGADLTAPGNVIFAVVNLLQLVVLLLFFMLVKPGPQYLYSHIFMTVLGFFLLALHYDAAGKMGDAHGTAGFVDMLTAGATGPEYIDSQVFVFNVNHNFLVELGIDEYGRKRGMAFAAGVERRYPDQAVHPDFPRVVRDTELREGSNSLDLNFEGGHEVTGRVVDASGATLLEQTVEPGDIFRMCQVKDIPIRDWVGLAVRRARATGSPAISFPKPSVTADSASS